MLFVLLNIRRETKQFLVVFTLSNHHAYVSQSRKGEGKDLEREREKKK